MKCGLCNIFLQCRYFHTRLNRIKESILLLKCQSLNFQHSSIFLVTLVILGLFHFYESSNCEEKKTAILSRQDVKTGYFYRGVITQIGQLTGIRRFSYQTPLLRKTMPRGSCSKVMRLERPISWRKTAWWPLLPRAWNQHCFLLTSRFAFFDNKMTS